MSRSALTRKRDYRSEIISVLQAFSASDAGVAESLRQRLGIELSDQDLPVELCRFWFDDIYLPSERYFDCPKGDIDESAVGLFFEHFNEDECQALERFHGCLELRLEILRKMDRELPGSEIWRNICKDAANTLGFFS